MQAAIYSILLPIAIYLSLHTRTDTASKEVARKVGIFIDPHSAELLNQLDFAKNFNWTHLSGAEVFTMGRLPASDYIEKIARSLWRLYLNAGTNSVVRSYRIVNATCTS
jgi:hypothetical protein